MQMKSTWEKQFLCISLSIHAKQQIKVTTAVLDGQAHTIE